MNIPDFEIRASLRADELRGHTPPDAETRVESDLVSLERQEARTGLPRDLESDKRYERIAIERRLVGELRDPAPVDAPRKPS